MLGKVWQIYTSDKKTLLFSTVAATAQDAYENYRRETGNPIPAIRPSFVEKLSADPSTAGMNQEALLTYLDSDECDLDMVRELLSQLTPSDSWLEDTSIFMEVL